MAQNGGIIKIENMKDNQQIKNAIEEYADMIQRICLLYLKNYHDMEDVFQEVFFKYALREEPFKSHDHEKAWLLRVAINSCKDILKSFFKRNIRYLEELPYEPSYLSEENSELLDAILKLPEKYRIVIYLFYYEEYTAVEIADMLNKKENTIYTWLARGRSQLKIILGGEPLA